MTNEKLQQLTKETILKGGNLRDFYNGIQYNPFPIGRKYAYNIAAGKFDQTGKNGLGIMRDYYRELKNDKQIVMKFYIRLLSYTEACKIVEFINEIVGCYANITTGGVSVSHSDEIDKDMIKHELGLHYPRFEITEDHPQEVKERIVDELGLK